MNAENLIIGNKYVPHQKTTGCSMDDSIWNKINKPYMYYVGTNRNGLHVFQSDSKGSTVGEFFNPEDVVPYEETNIEDIKNDKAYFKSVELYPTNDLHNLTKRSIFIAGADWQEQLNKELQEENEQLKKMHSIAINKYQEIQKSHDNVLDALIVSYKSLCTYGNHPIIEKQVESAIENAKKLNA